MTPSPPLSTCFHTQVTPGEILLEDYLEPMGISQNAMARAIGVAPRAINEIVHGKRSITPTMSIRFGPFFRQPVRRSLGEGGVDTFWQGLQVECDFRTLAKDRKFLKGDRWYFAFRSRSRYRPSKQTEGQANP